MLCVQPMYIVKLCFRGSKNNLQEVINNRMKLVISSSYIQSANCWLIVTDMTIPIIHLLIICLFVPLTASQSCYFDFEDDSELQNFNQVCNGALGSWQIDDRPEKPPPPSGTGDRVLVNKVQETSCMQSLNQVSSGCSR